ncbi:peptidase S9 prolyl oligopeptidase active site domain protein [Emticicia oligotrophica DSM 17448]|uniref:Peptidase S9 prolyl oligopeptidase active site domain protein n=1 Tax=Emticicia oligotrophica (strain DSM 17448 / CIP 109782 / MTCC 6937 / GPTSA100-15) TaxID=929562 RepID=A0ABM5N2J8_EMTOG|nr:prolyl oligopeptidase family serine peptidase [Emticicia oligotrophica]AFK03664.1 peptidase S9 prolyl oligopeptidase active site domain protein [Emticicia oligotrophica DSM 17448]
MRKLFLLLGILCLFQSAFSQALTVEKIMQDQSKWIGTSPSNIFWSEDGKTIYFSWNPDKNKGDSLYKFVLPNTTPVKVSPQERRALPSQSGTYNQSRSMKVFEKQGDIFVIYTKTLKTRQLTNTIERESNPYFSGDETKVIFSRNNNLYSLNLEDGAVTQLSNFMNGSKKAEAKPANDEEKWLKADQLAMFEVLKERKDKKDEADKLAKLDLAKRPKEIYLEDKSLDFPQISPDLRYITYRLGTPAKNAKSTIVPSYVTESGFTEDIPARTKVGAPMGSYENFVYDIKKDSVYQVITKDIPGITDQPEFLKDYAKKDTIKKKPAPRKIIIMGPIWSPSGNYAVVNIRSVDNKDRWIMQLDPATGKLKLLDRQHDEAWVAGPGIGFNLGGGSLGWVDTQTLYFQSEADGYSHLYTINLETGEKKQLTKGKFEVQQVQLSKDKKSFYLTTNEVHPGEQHFYKMSVEGGERVKLTSMVGANDVTLSPDESKLAIRYSYINKPWELFLQENTPNAKAEQLTSSLTEEFKAYSWKEGKVISFPARDGVEVYARIYEPTAKLKNKKAVIFVHGAGYLQNAHKWWSQYSREYMFHNLLVDKGYTVLDIDYRASAGYGRDHRTGIYRFMGGKDLEDNVDGAKLLVSKYGIDPKKIGIYGGSYGGFITLMAMFTTPDVFAAGAALRPVTDWAAYNHGYTANILNEPQTDSLAYRKSSPIYHAAGLKGHLLICHGMVDVNVHIQDSYRLVQRLIELKKENWEMASYPMEDHGFVEPTSWMDEYKRILKLFEERLK